MDLQPAEEGDGRPSSFSWDHQFCVHNNQSGALPQHNRFWQTVLGQVDSGPCRVDTNSISSAESSVIWCPIKYKLKLGLKGWTVLQTNALESVDNLPLLLDQHLITSNANLEMQNSIDADTTPHGMVLRPAPRQNRPTAKGQAGKGANACAAALSHLRNPDVEEMEQGLYQGIEVLYDRLQSTASGSTIFPIVTAPQILNHVFTRELLSSTFGGNMADTFAAVDQKRVQKSSYARFMCLNLLYNPHGPQFPGAPGLFYALRHPGRWPKEKELVFARYGTNRWNLMGKYHIRKSRPLSGEEFASLGANVQQTWLDNIWSHRWGDYTIAAVYLRREQGREPTDEDIELYAKTKISLVLRKVSREEVKEAFLSGEEMINVWAMTCIGYDEEFKRRLIPKAVPRTPRRAIAQGKSNVRYNLRSNKHKRPAAKSKGKRKASSAGESRTLKRRRI